MPPLPPLCEHRLFALGTILLLSLSCPLDPLLRDTYARPLLLPPPTALPSNPPADRATLFLDKRADWGGVRPTDMPRVELAISLIIVLLLSTLSIIK